MNKIFDIDFGIDQFQMRLLSSRHTCGTVGKNSGIEAVEDVTDKRLCRSVIQLFLENRRPSSVKFINFCSETVVSDVEGPK